jgi:hypothetical protein
MVKMANRVLWSSVALGQHDDGMTTLYNMPTGAVPGTIQYNGVTRVGVRIDAGSTAIGLPIKSVVVNGRKYGSPTGNITVGVRKALDDSLVTIGTVSMTTGFAGSAGSDFSFVVRLRTNAYSTVLNDVVSVEFPSSATDGFTILTNTSQGNPGTFTGRQHNGTIWSNSANPPSITFKG